MTPTSNDMPSLEASLRPARAEDAHVVASVLIESRRVFLPFAPSAHPPEEVQDWVAQHLLPTGGVTVAVVAGEVVAVLAVSENDTIAWIDQLYVLPGFDGRGLGGRLLLWAHAALKRPIRLFTFQQNTGARRFYERHGYEAIEFSDGRHNEERCPDVLYELRTRTSDNPLLPAE